jgi:hypothetical protein
MRRKRIRRFDIELHWGNPGHTSPNLAGTEMPLLKTPKPTTAAAAATYVGPVVAA